jgi:hypothetical protein
MLFVLLLVAAGAALVITLLLILPLHGGTSGGNPIIPRI